MHPQQSIPTQPAATKPGHTPKPKQQGEGWKSIVFTVLILVSAPLLALVLSTYVFQSFRVDGESMESSLQNNDRLIIWKFSKTWSEVTNKPYVPKRGDIIVFTKPGILESSGEPKKLIKRVIGLPGDRVVVKNGSITVYNVEHPEGFNPDAGQPFSDDIADRTDGDIDVEIADGELFVCGDNRPNSLDSRFFGTIQTADVKGNATYRIAPLNNTKNF